ncbi:tape measure protein [Gordonia phage SallySpecial]|uniref:Tape measure protein n=1 Tax=Gordonia phage SallySpecial TaxID=2079570 RepID=A0A2P1CC00_9CAUD|nr:tail length tape measure protein [Gordonia phage SallySpecial]AVJ48762.1 tape measure protein [Gordonia phage SallySpecial]
MANRSAILAIRIIADAAGASRGFGEAQGRMARFESGARRAGVAAAAVVGGMAAIGASAIESASRLQQATGAVESVFGRQAAAVQNLARSAATSVGLATAEYSELASVLGAQLNNLGVAQSELVPTTDNLIKKGADLAATFGGTTADAVQALSALFRGEADPIERYGVSIKQADINARLAANGQSKLTGEAKRNAETQARLALLTEQTAKATGQFARESDTTAGAQQRMAAQFENSKAAIGQSLLPIVAQFAEKLASAAEWAQRNQSTVVALATVVAGLAVAILAVNAALTVYKAVGAVVTAVQWAMNSAFLANPITWVVLAVIALIAVIVLIATKTTWFQTIWQAMCAGAVAAWRWITGAISAAIGWLAGVWSSIVAGASAAWNWVSSAAATAWNFVSSIVATVAGVIGAVIRGAINIVVGHFNRVRSIGASVFGAIRSVIDTVAGAIGTVVDWIRQLISWISNIKWPSPPGWLSSLFGAEGPAFMAIPTMASAPWENFAAGGPELSAARADPLPMLARIGAGGGGTVAIDQRTIINVDATGVADPQAVAAAVTGALRRNSQTRGVTPAVRL